MKWKRMSEITDEGIKFILKDILGIENLGGRENVDDENSILVTILSKWNYTDDDGKVVEYDQEDEIELTSERIEGNDYPIEREEQYKYKQYMIAKGYSIYWKENPYIE
jgi:hypothetical protein